MHFFSTKGLQESSFSPRAIGLAVGSVVFILVSMSLFTMYTLSFHARRDAVRRDLIHSAEEVAALVDSKQHFLLKDPSQAGSPLHTQLLKPLVHYHQSRPNLYYVFTLVFEEGKYYFILDTAADPTAPRHDKNVKPSSIKEFYEYTPEEANAIRQSVIEEGRPYTKDGVFSGNYGSFVTGFAPIKDEDGKTVAIAGVDISLEEFQKDFSHIFRSGLLSELGALVASLLSGWLVWWHARRERDALNDLRGRERQYRDLIHVLPAVVVEVNAAGNIVYANAQTDNLIGYTNQELFTKKLAATLLQPESGQDFEHALSDVMQHGNASIREYLVRKKGGGMLDMAARFSPIRDRDGIRGALVVFFDVSERKLMEDRLRHSEKMEAVGQLAGGVAHDFNNQLVVVLGYCDLIMEKLNDPDYVRKKVVVIHDAAKRSANLAKQLLAFARKGDFSIAPVNLLDLVSQTAELLRHTLGRNIEVSVENRADYATIMGDSSQIENALLNMAINARDAMPDGGSLAFRCDTGSFGDAYAEQRKVELVPGHYARITISDNGTGMAEEVRQRIFEPFFTTKEVGKGTGMGLAAVYGTVQNHGGCISCQSELGVGTTFEMLFPMRKASGQQSATAAAPSESGRFVNPGADAPCRSARVLIIDNEAPVAAVCQAMIYNLGGTAHAACNPAEAVEKYRSTWCDTDLVILDMVMPGMGGPEVFAKLKEINPQVRVVIISAYAASADTQKMLQEGACGFIQKPFAMAKLAKAINAALAPQA